ncbi:hypothetical protein ACFLYQ_05100 [Chloroflexota bacterium]
MKKKKKNRSPRKLPDFSLDDIINAPRPETAKKRSDGLGCTKCGSLKFISKGEIRVFRGDRMKVYHCYGCGQDFYRSE